MSAGHYLHAGVAEDDVDQLRQLAPRGRAREKSLNIRKVAVDSRNECWRMCWDVSSSFCQLGVFRGYLGKIWWIFGGYLVYIWVFEAYLGDMRGIIGRCGGGYFCQPLPRGIPVVADLRAPRAAQARPRGRAGQM